ncbi:MAG: hypothetical protein GY859_13695 [Desulfobacterales bacterium]|nr:hypothetical protein [Desulfobacterales bacterium]
MRGRSPGLAPYSQSNDKNLALEVIGEVGHGGNYLGHDHTYEHFSSELWHPGLFERRNYESWQKDGESDIRDVALERVRPWLEKERRPLLKHDVEAAMDEICEAARIDYQDA